MATLDGTFFALSDPTRRGILERLGGGPATISELAKPFGLTINGVKKHVGILERADLVGTEKVGRARPVPARPREHGRGDRMDGGSSPGVGGPSRSLRAPCRADLRWRALEFTFKARGAGTLMTMVHAGFPSEGLRDEHTVGLPNAFDRLERALDDRERI